MSVARNMTRLFGLLPAPALADITVLKCDFSNTKGLYFTIYDDGTPARIGVGPGVGDKGLVFRDPRNRTIVIVEQNLDGVPGTFTTITANMDAVHSRAWINLDGSISAPSQGVGQCKRDR